jgi:Tfp pilus assembly protein FimT
MERALGPHTSSKPSRILRQRGFSTLEIVVALAILFIVVAFAIPMVMGSVYLARVRNSANDLAGLAQQARTLAQKQNATLALYTGTAGPTNANGAFVNCSPSAYPCPSGGSGTTWVAGDPEVEFADGVSNSGSASAPTGLNLGFTPEADGTVLYFSPRGFPEKVSGSTYVLANGFVLYITDQHSNWAAVAVSPAGRTKVWVWNGSSWN